MFTASFISILQSVFTPSTVETGGTAPSLFVPPTRHTSLATEEDVPVMPSPVSFTTGTTFFHDFDFVFR